MNETAIKRLCAWPGVVWDIKWGGDLVGSVAGKMFCCLNLTGTQPHALSFKVEQERFLELTDRAGFRPAPYLARAHWVAVDDPSGLGREALRAFLRTSYELVRSRLPKKVQRELEAQEKR